MNIEMDTEALNKTLSQFLQRWNTCIYIHTLHLMYTGKFFYISIVF